MKIDLYSFNSDRFEFNYFYYKPCFSVYILQYFMHNNLFFLQIRNFFTDFLKYMMKIFWNLLSDHFWGQIWSER